MAADGGSNIWVPATCGGDLDGFLALVLWNLEIEPKDEDLSLPPSAYQINLWKEQAKPAMFEPHNLVSMNQGST